MSVYHIGEIVSLVFMAIALGMDAFSVSLGLGMQKIRLKRIAFVGAVVGLFHMIMPFIGILLGQAISAQIGQYAILTGGLLLVGIGAQMIFSAFNHELKRLAQPIGVGLIFFALSVSLDSFSVGLSLGLSQVKTAIALILFGAASMMLTWTGMILARKMHGLLGVYSEILGGSILCGFGLNILFG
ncbi:manganese efflux pump MntP family protein [Lentibacillus sp.]|uniref:manganese efflux pump MntP n=1 Tax=Lentibacillus sp. TaxID=1925746 RepID=UPI002B4B061D|nr:manganese efflux pump MntP family protein [Lentibacillus sp.]HLS09942.1 manganese efflux pump MntP family protein [Lentibacillus sp.]